MADEERTAEPVETENAEGNQTVTREQFEDLQKKFESVLAAQSGSDKKVAELQKALNDERAEKEKAKKTEAERLAELEQKWQAAEQQATRERLKGVARDLLTEAGIKTNAKLLERLVGADAEETQDFVKTYIEDVETNRAELAKKFDRQNGRKVAGSEDEKPNSYDALLELPPSELDNFTAQEIYDITHSNTRQ